MSRQATHRPRQTPSGACYPDDRRDGTSVGPAVLSSSMADSLTVIDIFARGVSVGAVVVLGLAIAASAGSRQVRWIAVLSALSIAAWLVTESEVLYQATGSLYLPRLPAFAVGGMFWLFALAMFEDRPPTLLHWAPALVLLVTGVICQLIGPPDDAWLWTSRNVVSGVLTLHAGVVVIRGWAGDLLEARRRVRGFLVATAAAYGVCNTLIWLVFKSDPAADAWLMWTVGRPYGVLMFAVILLAIAAVFLQARPSGAIAPRRAAGGVDGRAEAAERLMLGKLNELMSEGAWRREGLTIGEVARQLGEPEHRLRRLINQRMGHRNFADFVNGYRIEAAKARLADPQDARTTIAAIAFDLGYGSLGPFNRAFRAATGATPTEWRRHALQASPELQEAV
jgi:AraC-like DNA-binding protein